MDCLAELDVIRSDNFIYNFHTYEPFRFTHQRASWNGSTAHYMKSVTYPFDRKEHAAWYAKQGTGGLYARFERIDRAFLEAYIQPAADFIARHDRPLYCGEYGVIAHADDCSAERWLEDITGIFCRMGIGHAVWSYRGFSRITDEKNQVVSDRMIAAISRRDP